VAGTLGGTVVRACCLATVAALLLGAAVASARPPRSEPLRAHTGGFLTGPLDKRPGAVALDYVRSHPRAFELDANDLDGLRLTRSYRSADGVRHLQWEQVYRGLPVFGPGLRANVTAGGRLINVGEGAVADPGGVSIQPRLSATDAVLAAARGAHAAVAPGRPGRRTGAARATTFTGGDRASLTLYGGHRLAWRVLLRADPSHVYDAVVDATTGDTLYWVNMVKEAVPAHAFRNYPGAPVGGDQADADLEPWLTSSTTLLGANVHVYSDADDDIDGVLPDGTVQSGDEVPPSAPGQWIYDQVTQPATQPSLGQHCPAADCSWSDFDNSMSWTVNRNQAGTQLFFYANTFHDYLRDTAGIGFTSASGAFETTGSPATSDRVQAQIDDGATTDVAPFDDFPDCNHTSNANVLPVPDGEDLVMQMFLWSNACTAGAYEMNDVNGADDALIVYHEYTHGMTNRLVTDAGGFPAMNGIQAGAMDEGIADFYAFDYLVSHGLETDTAAPGQLVAALYENAAIRSQAIDCPVGVTSLTCPAGGYTYGDLGKIAGGPEVHADGEIWVETLWDLRAAEIAAHGASAGLTRMRALVTAGLRLAPANPTFLGLRNAILQADTVLGFGDRGRIWASFAHRGMGYNARTTGSDDTNPVQDFALPPVQRVEPPPTPDRTKPALSRASLTRRSIKVGARTAFRFTLSEVATVELGFSRANSGRRAKGRCRPATRKLRKRPRCTRYIGAGSIVKINMSAGPHSVAFAGRLRGHALPAGSYKVIIRATDPAGNRSRSVSTTLRIVRH
jgi:extracellular elastinolytic metalloproteinase